MTRSILLLACVLLVPIIPFLAFGDQLERAVELWTEEDITGYTAIGIVFGTLASDILLPIPSSAVCTSAGRWLGIPLGTFISWLGMTTGGLLGYGASYLFGMKIAQRLSDEESISRAKRLADRFGPMMVVVSRPIPVLAEATIIWLGVQRVPWYTLIAPLLITNVMISFGYAAFGSVAGQQGWFLPALVISAAFPLLLWIVVQFWLRRSEGGKTSDES